MGGGIIINSIKIFPIAFKNYCHDHINDITIFSVLFGLIAALFPVYKFFESNLYLLVIIILILIILILVHYHYWKRDNFFTIKINFDALLLIEGRNDTHLSIDISKFIVPSEDMLMLTITLEFDEYVKSDLLKHSYYTLIFKKPNNLEIKAMNNPKFNPVVVADGFDDSFYCIIVYYKNNSIDKFLFELQADENTNGELEIYFQVGEVDTNFNKVTSKKSPILFEEIYSRDINIDNECIIIIDKRKI